MNLNKEGKTLFKISWVDNSRGKIVCINGGYRYLNEKAILVDFYVFLDVDYIIEVEGNVRSFKIANKEVDEHTDILP